MKTTHKNIAFLSLLFLVLGIYANHMFSFTLFEGYSTLSNDSFSFVRLAKNWSPFTEPSTNNLETLPEHPRAPGFAWLLAVSGGAESTLVGHFLVSITMLMSIALCGWWAYRKAGFLIGIMLAVSFCLLPGVIISSMGILSENPYILLSLCVLLTCCYNSNDQNYGIGRYIVLLALLSLVMLTRTVGLSMAMAFIVVGLFDRSTSRTNRAGLLLTAVSAVIIWLIWGAIGVDSRVPSQFSSLTMSFTDESREFTESVRIYFGLVRNSVLSIAGAWSNYFTLIYENFWNFIFFFSVLAFCIGVTVIRAVRLKLDAVYLVFYILIIVLWPQPEAMVRFLHPVVMLLLLQPIFFFHANFREKKWNASKTLAISVILILVINSGFAQVGLTELKREANEKYPEIANSVEYYQLANRNKAIHLSRTIQLMMGLMKDSAEVVPPGSIVASIKHEAYLLFAERQSVMLTGIVPYLQQLCNFKIQDVDFVFIPQLTSDLTPDPLALANQYVDISEYNLTASDQLGNPLSHVIKLDKDAYESKLSASGYNCQDFQIK